MTDLIATRMDLRTWYGSSVKVPEYTHKNFSSFVASSIGIVRSIVHEQIGKQVSVQFMPEGTAHADVDNAIIRINGRYLEGYVEEGQTIPLPSDTAITMILGLIVHEAAHFAYSPKDLKPYRDYIQAHTKVKFHSQVAAVLGNIVEDIYIEAEVDRQVPTLTWMLNTLNEIFFSTRQYEPVHAKVQDIEDAPQSLEQVGDVLNYLIYAKTREKTSGVHPYLAGLFNAVRSATELVSIHDRFALALEVYDKLMARVEESGETSEAEGESDQPGDISGKSSKSLDEAKENAKGYSADHTEEGKIEEGSKAGYGPGKGAQAYRVERDLEMLGDSSVKMQAEDEPGLIGAPTTLYIDKSLVRNVPVELDARYSRLAEIGRQRAVVNRPYGMDTNRGTHIRKLHRIATDQKIFAQPVAMNNYKPMQVILLVDCSGSMMQRVRGSVTRIENALKATLGAATGLAEARCEVAVYGHTAEILGGSEVVIYEAKKFNEPLDGLDAKLGQLLHVEEKLQNRDGYAVAYVGKKFTDRRKRRVLIVISDGEPAAGFYHGETANRHTKEAVDALRRDGVDVLSISITSEANRVNNYIYGARFNVYNEDPNVIESIARALVME